MTQKEKDDFAALQAELAAEKEARQRAEANLEKKESELEITVQAMTELAQKRTVVKNHEVAKKRQPLAKAVIEGVEYGIFFAKFIWQKKEITAKELAENADLILELEKRGSQIVGRLNN